MHKFHVWMWKFVIMLQVIQFSFSLREIGLSRVWEILVYKKAWLNHIHYRLEFDSHFVPDQPYFGCLFLYGTKGTGQCHSCLSRATTAVVYIIRVWQQRVTGHFCVHEKRARSSSDLSQVHKGGKRLWWAWPDCRRCCCCGCGCAVADRLSSGRVHDDTQLLADARACWLPVSSDWWRASRLLLAKEGGSQAYRPWPHPGAWSVQARAMGSTRYETCKLPRSAWFL